MSSKDCDRCGNRIVFGKDKDTGRIIPLSLGSRVYRMVKENIVELDPKAWVRHVCVSEPKKEPSPAVDFTEPKEPAEPDTIPGE